MEILLPDPRPLDRDALLACVIDHLEELVQRPLRWVVPAPPGAPPAVKALALDAHGVPLAVRWIEPGAWPSDVGDVLTAHARMRREWPAWLPMPADGSAPAIAEPAWILVGIESPAHWDDVTAALAVPLLYLRLHRLQPPGGGVEVLYAEPIGAAAFDQRLEALAGAALEPSAAEFDTLSPLLEWISDPDAGPDARPTAGEGHGEPFELLDAAERSAFDALRRALARAMGSIST